MRTLNYISADENARGAAINAMYRNQEMAATYSASERIQAQKLIDIVDLGYAYKDVYTNYRKKFITVKFVGLQKRDRRIAAEVDRCFQEKGYDCFQTPQGTVYHIPRSTV